MSSLFFGFEMVESKKRVEVELNFAGRRWIARGPFLPVVPLLAFAVGSLEGATSFFSSAEDILISSSVRCEGISSLSALPTLLSPLPL